MVFRGDEELGCFEVDRKCGEGVVGRSAQAEDDDAGDDERDGHEQEARAWETLIAAVVKVLQEVRDDGGRNDVRRLVLRRPATSLYR